MKLYNSIEYLHALLEETECYQRVAWESFCQVHKVTKDDLGVILCFVQNEHAVHCKVLCELYPTPKEWFEKGAFEQSEIDLKFHTMVKLLSTFSFV